MELDRIVQFRPQQMQILNKLLISLVISGCGTEWVAPDAALGGADSNAQMDWYSAFETWSTSWCRTAFRCSRQWALDNFKNVSSCSDWLVDVDCINFKLNTGTTCNRQYPDDRILRLSACEDETLFQPCPQSDIDTCRNALRYDNL